MKYTQSISKSLEGSQAVRLKECTQPYMTETESRRLTNQEFERRRVYAKPKWFAICALMCAPVVCISSKANAESIVQQVVHAEEAKLFSKLWQHFDFTYKRLYLRADGGSRKYTSRIKGFNQHPKTSKVFLYGIGYRCADYPMRFEFNVQSNNFKLEGNGLLLKNQMKIFSLNIYRDFVLPNIITTRIPLTARIRPHINASIGLVTYSNSSISARVRTRTGAYRNHSASLNPNNGISWSLGIGSKLYFAKQLAVDITYKYVSISKVVFNADNQTRTIQGQQLLTSLIVDL